MGPLHAALDFFLHVNKHLNDFAGAHPIAVYGVLALIVFTETGLVVWPFLPGDSLLFAVGALAATAGSSLNLPLVILILCVAANLGDLLNYFVGRRVGPQIFFKPVTPEYSIPASAPAPGAVDYQAPVAAKPTLFQRLLSRKHLEEANAFYARHGRKTLIIARFVPIIRTFAPFVAGVGEMAFTRFIGFSVVGGVLWVTSVTLAGYFFGGIPAIKDHFEFAVLGIVAVSLIPIVVSAISSRRKTATGGTVAG